MKDCSPFCSLSWDLSDLTEYTTSYQPSALKLQGAPLTNMDVMQFSDPVKDGLITPHCLQGRSGLSVEEGRTDFTSSPWLHSSWALERTKKPQGDHNLGV